MALFVIIMSWLSMWLIGIRPWSNTTNVNVEDIALTVLNLLQGWIAPASLAQTRSHTATATPSVMMPP
jgi:hypothetical protein